MEPRKIYQVKSCTTLKMLFKLTLECVVGIIEATNQSWGCSATDHRKSPPPCLRAEHQRAELDVHFHRVERRAGRTKMEKDAKAERRSAKS